MLLHTKEEIFEGKATSLKKDQKPVLTMNSDEAGDPCRPT